MSNQPSSRDLKKLSAYLDGELSASATRKLEKRLSRDPNWVAALEALTQSRTILRRTPQRHAPRNFTLSPQMVAKRPPMPRLVPALNYASVAAILLFLFSFINPVRFAADQTMESAPMMAMEIEEMAPVAEEPLPEMAAAPAVDSDMEKEMPAAEDSSENLAGAASPAATAAGTRAEKTYAATPEAMPTMLPPTRTIPAEELESPPLLTPYQRALVILLGFFAILSWVVRRATIAKWRKAAKNYATRNTQ